MHNKDNCLYECRVGKIQHDITTFWMLSKMCWVGTKLYNTALWHSKEVWGKTGKIPNKYALQKILLQSWFRDYLPCHTSQRCANKVGEAYVSWFERRKEDPTSNPPGFRKKEELSSITFTRFGFKYDHDTIKLTVGKKLRQDLAYPRKYLALRVQWHTPMPAQYEVQQVEIVPREEGWFELHAKIAIPMPVWNQDGQVVAVDYGQKVPIAATFQDGTRHLFKGGAIQAQLHYLNKTKGHMQRHIMKQHGKKVKWSRALGNLSDRLNGQKDHALHALADQFVEECVKVNTAIVVGGDLKDIKKDMDTGQGKNWNKKASQNWQQFPTRKLASHLRYKLARRGILYIERSERGTSKRRCCMCGCTDRKKLHRVRRGMFRCENCGIVQHADLNGSGNQLAMYLHHGVLEGSPTGSSGRLARPTVWRWDNHLWQVVS